MVFKIRYRLMMDNEPVRVSLRARLVQEQDGPQLIVGGEKAKKARRRRGGGEGERREVRENKGTRKKKKEGNTSALPISGIIIKLLLLRFVFSRLILCYPIKISCVFIVSSLG